MIRIIARGAVAAGAVTIGIATLAGPASAHTPKVKLGCTQLEVAASDYPSGSHVFIAVDGATQADVDFSGSYSKTLPWSSAVNHGYLVRITSPDHVGEVDQAGTQQACQSFTVPTTAPAPTTTTVAKYRCPGVLPPAEVPVGDEGRCPPPTVLTSPVPTTTPCPDGVPWNTPIGGPGWCGDYLTGTVPPTTPTTTPAPTVEPAQVCADAVTLEDGSVVCNDTYGAPPAQNDTPARIGRQGPAAPTKLPATGDDTAPLVLGACAALTVGCLLVLFTRRRAHN